MNSSSDLELLAELNLLRQYADLALKPRQLGSTQLDLALEPKFWTFLKGARHARPPFQRGLPISLFQYEKDMVHDFFANQINLWMLGRQVGKTSLAALILAFLSKEISGDCLIESYRMDRSEEIILYTKEYCRQHDDPYYAWNMANDAAQELKFKTGFRIVALPSGQAARGYSPSLLITDESHLIVDQNISAFLPTSLATAAKRIHMGTVWGTSGWFWRFSQMWEQLGYGFKHVTSEEALRPNGPVIKAELDRLKLELGDLQYQQEALLIPIPDIDTFFGADLVRSCFGERV